MGFWDRELSGLVALGIELSSGQLRLLEEGGEGLALRTLPDPSHFGHGCGAPYLDTNGDLALYACPVTAYAPDDTSPYHGETPVDIANTWWDTDWCQWPAVLGVLDDPNEGLWGPEEMVLLRPWSVIEADDATLTRFVQSVRGWLGRTYHEPLAYVAEQRTSGVDCGDEPCREDCKHLGDDDHDCVDIDEGDNPGFWHSAWILQDAGYAHPEDPTHILADPPVPPFEEALDGEDLALYARLKRRSRQAAVNALGGIRPDQRAVYMRHEGAYEPWY